jgi:hypothetical protein
MYMFLIQDIHLHPTIKANFVKRLSHHIKEVERVFL